MELKSSGVAALAAACGLALSFGTLTGLGAQQPPAAPPLNAGIAAPVLYLMSDANTDGVMTRDELKAAWRKWFSAADSAGAGSITQAQLAGTIDSSVATALAPLMGGGRGPQNQTPRDADVQAMMAALPATAPAKPARPRKVLVLAKSAGFVHSSIPLAAKTIEALGTKTGAWATTVTYDAADITAENLKQYDAVFLASTTGAFLDDPANATVTAARRQALLDFVRGGKGLAGIHAATDSYHAAEATPGRGATRGGGAPAGIALGAGLAPVMFGQGDKNGDQKLNAAELDSLADAWFDKLDTAKTGKVSMADVTSRFGLLVPGLPGRPAAPPAAQGPDNQIGTWPEFNTMIGGYFKFHWLDPQLITVKIDDPKSPLTAMFHGQAFEIHDETYTMGIRSWSRENVHVLTSIDYAKMSDEDKAKEDNPRPDHDYGLSWIRREGQGRVFYEAHGHSERNYAVKPLLEHILAGMQYVIGDLKADDSPSAKPRR
jgi:type 1 glutamine amidotransferase